jgi:hypothetical protein
MDEVHNTELRDRPDAIEQVSSSRKLRSEDSVVHVGLPMQNIEPESMHNEGKWVFCFVLENIQEPEDEKEDSRSMKKFRKLQVHTI